MSELFRKSLDFFGLLSNERMAGEAMACFRHKQSCPAYGKELFDSAELLQIGQSDQWMVGDGGAWGSGFGSYVKITYIQCSGCGNREVFQEQ